MPVGFQEYWFVLHEHTDDEEIETNMFRTADAAEDYGVLLASQRNTKVRILQELTVCLPPGSDNS